jgi:hypothetical protein
MGFLFPYQSVLVGNWSSLWITTLPYRRLFFFLKLQHSSSKQIVSLHVHYIFKNMHTNSPSYFHIFKHTNKNEISLFTYASFQHINFPNAIQISIFFNQCPNIHGHIHTQCALALISSFPHFMTSTFPWCVGA